MRHLFLGCLLLSASVGVAACSSSPPDSTSEPHDAGPALDDARAADGSASDAAASDATVSPVGDDGGSTDAAPDANAGDASLDAPVDAPVDVP